MANTTTLEIGQSLVIDGEIRTIESIKGRWVKLDDGTNISRTEAQEAHEEYLEDAEEDAEEIDGYAGPMLRLRERLAEGAYQKAPNGQPCCGDQVATLLGTLAPAAVIRACIVAMNLPANPYAHLNVGQQSMNLRNKLRGCFKREEFGMGVLIEAVEQIQEELAAAPVVAE